MFHNFIFILLAVSSCYSYRPNVLFIILDDFKPALSTYGDRLAYTPNIDNLASKSFVFNQAYAQVITFSKFEANLTRYGFSKLCALPVVILFLQVVDLILYIYTISTATGGLL